MRLLGRAALLLVFVFIYLRLRNAVDAVQLSNLVFDWLLLLGSLAVFELYLLSSALLWYILTRRAGIAIGVGRSLVVWLFSIVGKYVPGKALLWGIRYVYYHQLAAGFSALRMLRCLTIEYLGGLVAGVGFSVFVVTLIDELGLSAELRIAALVLLGVLGLLFVFNHTMARGLVTSFAARVGIRSPGRFEMPVVDLGVAFFWSLVNWNILGFAVFLIARALRPELGVGDFLYVSASYAVAGIVGFLAVFAPSGIGVREAVFIEAMARLMPLGDAALLAAMARLVSTIGEVLSAGISYLVEPGVRGSERVHEPSEEHL